MNRPVYIYALKDPLSGDARYVGLTRFPVKRLNNHCHKASTPHLRNWISKLRKSATRPEMEILEISDEQQCSDRERHWIRQYRAQGFCLLNYTDGGESGFTADAEVTKRSADRQRGQIRGPLSDETKRKLSEALRGRAPAIRDKEAWLAKVGKNNYDKRRGVPLSNETRKKVSESVSRAWTPELRAMASVSHKGRKPYVMTPEIRARISESVTKTMTPEHRARISATKMGCSSYVRTPEIKAKCSEARKMYFARIKKGSQSGQVRVVNQSS